MKQFILALQDLKSPFDKSDFMEAETKCPPYIITTCTLSDVQNLPLHTAVSLISVGDFMSL